MTGRDCPRYRELIVERLAGELRPPASAELDRHLGECEACAQELASLSGVVDRLDVAVQELPAPPEWLATRAMARARGTEAGSGARQAVIGVRGRWSGWLGRSALAGAAAAAAITLLLGWQPGAPGVTRAPASPQSRIAAQEAPAGRQSETASPGELAQQSQVTPQPTPQARFAPQAESAPQAKSAAEGAPGPQSSVSIMMKGSEEGPGGGSASRQMDAGGPRASVGVGNASDWIAVFSGTPEAAQEAAAMLVRSGIPHESRFLAADSTVVVTVASQDWEKANEVISATQTTPRD